MEKIPKLRMRIYTTESAQHDGHSLFEHILNQAKELHLAGATVYRGIAGFGKKGKTHTARLLEMSCDLPIIIDIIDEPSKIEAAAEQFTPWIQEGILTLEEVILVQKEGTKPMVNNTEKVKNPVKGIKY